MKIKIISVAIDNFKVSGLFCENSSALHCSGLLCENSSPLQCGFKNVTKYLGNMSENAKYLGKLFQKMVQKSKIESRRIFENSNGPSFRKDIYRNYSLDTPGNNCGGSSHLSCKRDQIIMRDSLDRAVTPPKRVTSHTWGPPPPCKQVLR